VFSGVERIDRIARNGTHRAGASQVERLVRDNRVVDHRSPQPSGQIRGAETCEPQIVRLHTVYEVEGYHDEHHRLLPGVLPGWGMSWWWHEQRITPADTAAMSRGE
jgi:hypothetical protein